MDTDAAFYAQVLDWEQDNTGRNPATLPNVSTVTFTFSRPVSNFSITVTDIDRNTTTAGTYTDRVTFDGYAAGSSSPLTLTTANVAAGNTNQFVGSGSTATAGTAPAFKSNAVTGNADSPANAASNVTATFPTPIQKLVVTYENVAPYVNATTSRLQAIGITQMSWCAQADIQTVLTGPTRAQATKTVALSVATTNNGPDLVASITPTVQLPANLSNVTGGTYTASTGLLVLPVLANLASGASVAQAISYTMPATGSVAATSAFTSTANDLVSTNNTSTLTTAQNRPPVASDVTNSPGILSSTTSQTTIASLNASDPDAVAGNTTITSFTIVSLPTPAQGTLYVNSVAATAGQVITVPGTATPGNPGYQLSFVPNGTFGGSAAFTYKATDDVGVSSNTANYSIPVTAGADLATVVNGSTTGVEGQSKSYSATTTNNGPATATNVVQTLLLSNKPAFSTVTVANGGYDPATGLVTFNPTAALASGAQVVNTVTVVVQATPATFNVTAANTSNTADPTPANNNGTAAAATVAVSISPIGPAGTAGPCATPGRDGSPTALAANPNTYYSGGVAASATTTVAQTVLAGAKTLNVAAATGTTLTPIAPGDLLLVIQMQGADINVTNTDAYGDGVPGGFATNNLNNSNFTAGQYEYVVVAPNGGVTTAGGTLTFTTGLKNGYQNADYAAASGAGQRRFQIVRIPQYANLTLGANLVPTAWDGNSGGIIVLDVAGKLAFNGFKIDASGAGFRGGAGRMLAGDKTAPTTLTATDYRALATLNANGMKGEGVAGTPRYVNTGTGVFDTGFEGYGSGSAGRGGPGNGGGGGTDANPTSNDQNTGGGGGGNGSRGGRGGNSWSGNAAVGGETGGAFNPPSSSRLILGGGGGAGSSNNDGGGAGYASSGAAGGGIVLVRTGSVSGFASVLANGGSASNAVLNDGSGGGGAGGSILFTANNTTSLGTLTLAANGGSGGTNTGNGQAHGPGGGGGGGIVLSNAVPAGAAVAGGANGLTAGNIAYGASAGLPGIANTRISNSIANSVAGINCSVDVVATLTAPASAVAAQSVNLTATFANNGGQDASTVTRQVVLSSGSANDPVTSVSAPGSTSISTDGTTGNVTITYPALATLAAGASNSLGITYTAPGTAAVAATATVATASAEPVTSNNTSTASTAITGFADVTSAVSGLASSITGRPTGTYSVAFANNGPAAAANVTRTVQLPSGVSLTAAQLKVVTDQGGTYNSSTNVLDFGTLATLNTRGASIFQFSYTAPDAGGNESIVSTVTTTTAQDASGTKGVAPDVFTLAVANNSAADVATNGITLSATTATPGQQVSFTANFLNNGPGDAVNAVRFVQLNAGLQGVTVSNGGTYDSGTGLVTYAVVPSLTAGATAPSTITFLAPAVGPVVINASITTTGGPGSGVSSGIFGNNAATARVDVTPVADVATGVTGPVSVVAGNLATFSVTTSNNGPSGAAGVVQTVQLPAQLAGVFASKGGLYDAASGVVTFPAAAVLSNGAVLVNTVSFVAPAANFTVSAAVATTTAEASGTTANNTAAAAATVVAPATANLANLFSTLSSSARNVAPGAPETFTVGTGNNGPQAATNVVQQLQLPTGLSGVVASNSGSYNSVTGVVTFPALASLTSGTSVVNTVTFNVPATGPVVASATVSSDTSDPVPADNRITRVVDLTQVADVATTLVGPAAASATEVMNFFVNTINNGPVPATNVVQTVAIPAGLAPADVTVPAGVYDPATGLITFPAVASLGVGEVRTYTYAYTAPAFKSTDSSAPKTIINQAVVTTSTPDGLTANNTASVATAVKWNSDVSVAVDGPTAAVVGNLVVFSVAFTNNGPAPAATVVPSVRIATGLSGVVASGGGTYDASTGIVTFPTISNQAVGVSGTVTNVISLPTPDRPIIGVGAVADVSTTTNDFLLGNNAATIVIPVSAITATQVDLTTVITSSVASQQANKPVTLTVTASNVGTVASAMRQRVILPAGLSSVTAYNPDGTAIPNGRDPNTGLYLGYNPASGMVTFPPVASQAPGTSNIYSIVVADPGNDPLVATAYVNGPYSDPAPANNQQTVNVTIVPAVDVATNVSGPATMLPGARATYQVVTINNGPSPASTVVQTVQLPTSLTGVAVTGGGTYDPASGKVTFPTIATQVVGAAGEVTNSVSFTFPTTTYTVVGTVSTTTTEIANGANNNTSSQATTLANLVPLANTRVNTLQSPMGNTAAATSISSLIGFDPDGSPGSFTITSLPAAAAGVLSLNGTPVGTNQVVSLADVANLTFAPAATFVGNASFNYLTTDNQGAVSAPGIYTIAIGQDNASVFTGTPVKGGTANQYQNGDIIANAFDANGGTYTAAAAVADNGLRTSSVSSGALPAGLQMNPVTGQISVLDRTLLMAGTYPVTITTVDANGGITTQVVPVQIGANPLPVVLTSFTANATGPDAQLKWATAQEQDNAGFQVERSFDGARFEPLGFVAGAGTSSQPSGYAFVDAGVGRQHPGTVYYRLQQLDRFGKASSSPVRTVAFAQAQAQAPSVTLYPNPADAYATLDLTNLPAATYQVGIIDITGRTVQSEELAGGLVHTLSLDALASGSYVVVIRHGNLKIVQHLIKR
ncbi:hypothetical protein AXW84_14815 [Hymenobacter sp. PAMC 26628]|nr:hypothetical protein AXW84_14815 [Hymenobacter sp. PAMC 26628]